MRRAVRLAAGLLVLLAAPLRADDAEDVPLVGRPALLPFSGASARFARRTGAFVAPFAVTATATPTELRPQAPTTLTVTLRARGPVLHPPVRIDLRQVEAFSRHFRIEDLTDTKKERLGPSAWRYVYRLTPRSAEVEEIPGFPLVFYNPDLRPPDRAFQVTYSDPIPIHQAPARTVTGPAEVDESSLALAEGPAVLVRSHRWRGPGRPAWIAGLFLPPLASVLCYLVWRRLNPDAARRAARRRSRAARTALATVHQARQASPPAQAERLAQALFGYLRERFDLAPREPTPEEVALHLTRIDVPEALIDRTADLLARCAAVRFGADPGGADLVEPIARLVLDLEEAQCPA